MTAAPTAEREADDVSPVFKQLSPEEAAVLLEAQRKRILELLDQIDAERAKQHAPSQEAELREALEAARENLAFFASVIKSGEPFTEVCGRKYADTKAQIDAALARSGQAVRT